MSQAPFNWIQKVEEAIIPLAKEIPLWGNFPAIALDKISAEIKQALHLPELHLSLGKTNWLGQHDLLAGLGDHPQVMAIEMAPITTPIYWVMSATDVAKLTAFALHPPRAEKGFSDKRLQEGFYSYMLLQSLDAAFKMHAFQDLTPTLNPDKPMPHSRCLGMDISIGFNHHTLWGRILCPEEFIRDFRQHFINKPPVPFSKEISSNVDLSLRVECGHVALTPSQWKKVHVGDVLILDRCTYDPKTNKGSGELVLSKTPLFRVRLRPSSLKVVDYAQYHEETNTMKNPDDREYVPEEEEFPEETPEEESHLWSPPPSPSGESPENFQEIPITLTVEVGRISMNLEKVLDLQPGNMIELAIRPEQGVWLTVQGKRVAKGELVSLGDVLGVRILKLG